MKKLNPFYSSVHHPPTIHFKATLATKMFVLSGRKSLHVPLPRVSNSTGRRNIFNVPAIFTNLILLLLLLPAICQHSHAQNIVSVEPKDGDTNVKPDTDLVITFDVPVEAGKGQIELFENNKSAGKISVKSKFVTINGNKAVIDIKKAIEKALKPGSSIYVIVPDGAFIDGNRNEIKGITDPEGWNYTLEGVTDETPPTITGLSPANGSAGVTIDADLVLTFDEEVLTGTGNIIISQGTTSQTIAVTDDAVSIAGNKVTINSANFPNGETISIMVPEGAFTDEAGNAFAGIASTDWTFVTEAVADDIAPTVTVYTPADEATAVVLSSDLVLTFDEAVVKGTGDITITQEANSQTIAVTNAAVSINGSEVRINPPADFPSQTQVSIQIEEGAFKDVAGNAFAGITNATTWNFATQDKTAPVVTAFSPSDNFIGAEANANLVLTFDEAVEKGTGNITLTQGESSQVVAVTDASVTVNGSTVTIDPPQDFPSQTQVSVQIQAGAFTDIADNEFAGITGNTTWNFTTQDKTVPTLTSFTPANKATEVAIDENLILTFDEPVEVGTGTITINQGTASQTIAVTNAAVTIANNVVTINPTADFPNNTTVTVTIPEGAITDAAGNAFAGIASTDWSFTTEAAADSQAPTITAYSPANESSDVDIDASLTLTFSEAIKAGTGNIVINQGATSQTIPVTDASVSVNGDKVTINPSADFPSGAKISVQMPAGAFQDLAGNNHSGITSTDEWKFTVKDVVAPSLVSVSPPNGETNVAVNENLVLTFDENVEAGSGNIILSQGTTTQTIAVASPAVSIAANIVTINPADFIESIPVSVEMLAGVFRDMAGNSFAGIDAADWRFTTGDFTNPTVSSRIPAHNATEIDVDATLKLVFSEAIVKGTGSIVLTQGAASQAIAVTEAAVNVTGNEVTINPPADFAEGIEVSVTIPAGVFTDAAGNTFTGIPAGEWNFTTKVPVDDTAPAITAYSPVKDAGNIVTTENLVLTFSEQIAKGTGNITISQGSSSQTIPVTDAAVSVNGDQVTINPPSNFPEKSQISIQIEAGTFTDIAGNAFAGIADNTTWRFTTEDKTAPNLITLSPADKAINVAVDANLVLTFDETIKKGAGDIVLTQGTTSQTIAVTDASVSVDGDKVTINPADFPNNTTLTVTVTAGAFTDIAGNAFAGIVATDWSFTTEAADDTEAPTITTYTPADNATNVVLTSDLVLTFSEPVVKGTGNITITQGAASQTIAVTNAAVSINGNEVTINPPADFPSQTQVSVQIQAGAFTDVTGNAFAGITDNTTWNFTTQDKTAPILSAFTPANNASDIAITTDLVLTFSENIKAGTGNITINQGTSSQTISVTDASVNVNGDQVTINPSDFPNSETISVTIPEGAFTDAAGNAYAGITAAQWSFTTEAPDDMEAPIVITYSPTKNGTNVALASDLVLTFSEEVAKGTGNITIIQGTNSQTIPVNNMAVTVNGTVVTIDPPQDFPSQTQVSVQIAAGAFKDIAGNAYAGIADNTGWNFTTEDKTVPTLTSFTPANNAINIAVDANLVLSFDETVKVGTGSIVITHGVTSQTITVTGALVSVNGTTVTVNPADFPNDAIVTVSFPAGAFTDLAGNAFAGIPATDWRFTTSKPADSEAPLIGSTTPADESENVAINANLVITFNEPVEKGTGNITITQGATSQTIAVTNPSVSINGDEVTINPPADFPQGTPVSVQIAQGAFQDAAGNEFAGITNTTTWNFTTIPPADVTSPVVTTYAPADESVNVASDVNLVLTFDEEVKKGAGNITITQGNTTQVIAVTSNEVSIAGKIVTIDPANIFPSGASIVVQIAAGVFTDVAGNPYEGISNTSTWNFSVADTAPPAVVSFTPADEATNVAVDAGLEIVYSEPVIKGTGSITITQGTGSQVINVSDAAVSITGTTVNIIPPADFPANTLISIQMPAGTFKDLSGNAAAAIANTTDWNFTTAAPVDATVPTISTLAPADEATNVSIDRDLVITFSEDVEVGVGNIIITHGTSNQTIAITSAAVTVNGTVVTINPPQDFPSQTQVSVQIQAGAFTDIAGNAFAGITDNTTWNFTTQDKTVPTLTSFTPANKATEVAIDENLILTFDEAIKAGTGTITINQGTTSQTIPVTDAGIGISGNIVTIDPADFPNNTTLTVTVTAGAFTDIAGNAFAGIVATDWSFTTEAADDTEAPTITTYTPADNATNVVLTSDLVLTFSEPVEKGTGDITITQGATSQTIAVTNAAVSINGSEVRINPPSDFPSQTQVSIQIEAGAFQDVAGNAYAGIPNATTWNFATQDKTAPVVTAFSPSDNFIGAEANANLVLTFDEAVEKGTGTIILHQGLSTQEIALGSAGVSVTDKVVTIDPPSDFPFLASVWVEIPQGAFRDLSGNVYAGISEASVWNFTVIGIVDNTAPVVTATTPADGATEVVLNSDLQLTFSEEVEKGTGTITLNQGESSQVIAVTDASVTVNGSTVTIDPPQDFPSQTQVSVQIQAGAFTDIAGNAFAGITDNTTWNFTTIDETAPTLTTFTPANNATDVVVDADLILTFDEAIKAGTGTITINQGTTSQTIPVTDAGIGISGNIVTIDPADFPNNTTLTVTVTAGAFTDIAGNAFAGVTTAQWSFTTEAPDDTEAPTVTAYTPADNATNVVLTSNLVLTFSEPVEKGTGNITITQGATSQTIAVTNAAVSINGNEVTINPPADFPSQTLVSVQIQAGSFTDVTGNAFAGITDNTTWNFTTEDKTNPVIVTFSPLDNALQVPIDENLEITFDENIQKGTGEITINQGSTTQQVAISSANVSIVGTKVTIDIPGDMPAGTDVYVQMPEGAFTDTSGNPSAAVNETTAWNFKTADPLDITPPSVVTLFPVDNATDVAIDSDLVITFDEAVKAGSGSITINDGEIAQTIAVTDAAVSIADNIVTINAADFPNSATVTITVPAGAFEDEAGNTFAGIAATAWTFTTEAAADSEAPVITTYVPADEATDVAITQNLIFTFSEEVEKGTGNITITQGATSQTIAVTDPSVSVNGDEVTINPPADFPQGTPVSVQIDGGAFQDAAGNEFGGITNNTTWNFTTAALPDNVDPTLVSLVPANNAANVAVDANLVLNLSEAVVADAGNIVITQGATSQIIAITDAAVAISGNEVTINPPDDFPNNETITIAIPAGALKDAAANEFAGIAATSWSFTTQVLADTEAPTITTYAPADEAVNVPVASNLVITFNEPVVKGAGNIVITQSATTQTIAVSAAAVSINGNEVTINPPSDFPEGTAISVQIVEGAFQDAAGNDFAGITATNWSFTTVEAADNTAPTVTAYSPANGSTNVPAGQNLTLTFSEEIVAGTGKITITQGNASQEIVVPNGQITITGNTVTINPTADLLEGEDIVIQIAAGTFTDLAGNPFGGILNATTWAFSTEAAQDETAPVVNEYTPADNAVDVALNTNLVLTFDEPVEKGTGNITITLGTLSQTIAVTNAAVVVSGNTVTINPETDFAAQTQVYVQIEAGAFKDIAGNEFEGITDNTTWNFTTAALPDNVDPTLVSLVPANNAANVAVDANLVLNLSEAVIAGAGNIVITQGTTSQTIPVTDAAVTIADNEVTINPADFPNNEMITIAIPAGAFKDAAGNAFAGIAATDWSFTTEILADTEAPVITTYAPADEAVNVPVASNLVLTFNEPVVKGAGNIVITQSATTQTIAVTDAAVTINGNEVTINPPADFPQGMPVSVQIDGGAFQDAAGNEFGGITNTTTWNFTTTTTIDETAPTLTTFTPANNATDVVVDADLVLTFDEAIKAGTGNIVINQGTTSQTIPVTNAAVTIADNVVTINPANFPNGATITVTVPEGAFTDAAGNAFAGVTTAQWSFTTEAPDDTEAPTVTAYTPADNATNVVLTSNLVLTFSEPVEKGTGNITITQGATSQTIAVTNAAVSINGNEVTINPPADFPSQTLVSVQIQAGSFTDVTGNAFAGITDNTTWNFTTEDKTNPVIVTFSPLDNALQVPIDENLEITFDENIQKGTGEITINQGSTTQQVAISSANVSIVGTKVTIDIPGDMPAGTDVYVQMPEGAFTDTSGNPSAAVNETTAWNFKTADPLDITPPSVVTLFPVDNATDVAIDSDLVITFDEAVKAGSGSITINDGEIAQTIAVTDAAVSIADNIVTINAADFPNSATVTITVPAGAFEDEAGNTFAGIAATAWTFTTEAAADSEAPVITTYVPADEATDVAITQNLIFTFSEEVEKGTGNITITQGATSQTIAVTDPSVSVNGDEVTINPPADFPQGMPVSVQIDGGAFQDAAGNEFGGITNNTTWNFTTTTTIDETAPTLTTFTPANNATDVVVDADLVLTFDEAIKAGTGNIVINQGETSQTIAVTNAIVTIANNVVTINPADFPNGATITVTVPAGAFTDAAGNAFAGIAATDWSFTTQVLADSEAPTITTYAPADEAVNVPVASNLVLTFNEPVVAGQGNIIIAQGTTSQTIAVTDATVSIDGTSVTINPPSDFPQGAAISVQIEEGAFADAAENEFEGITDNTTWNFTTTETIDETAPILTNFTPANGATNIAITANLVLTFGENIQAGTGNIVISQGETSQTIAVTDAIVTIANNVVTINPADFPNGATITVTVPAGAFTDAAGNAFAGIAATDWSFTTIDQADSEAPIVTTLVPADEAINIALDANLVITFSEAVVKGEGNITINQGGTSQTIAVTDAAVSIEGTTVTINPPTDLPAETAVSVQIEQGAFKDVAGNAFAGIADNTTWNFTTISPEDNSAPLLTSFTPAHNTTNIATGENITLTFSETVTAGEGNITIDQGSTSQTIATTDAAVTIADNVVTINAADFPSGTIVTVTIPEGAFTDAAGNAFAGIAATDWSFTTQQAQDATPPVLIEILPVEGAVNVAVNENISLTFDENVKTGSGNITISQGATSQTIPVTDASIVNITGNIVTINPADFPNSATITVTIPAGAFQDASGNNSAAITRTFSVTAPADETDPLISSLSPPDDAIDVTVNADLVITFNEEVKKGTGAITITQGTTIQTIDVTDETVSIQGTRVTINPPEDFPAGSAVSIQIPEGVFTDIAGNPFAGITNATTWNFTVASPADNTPPQVVSFAPADNAQNVAASSNLIITFNEPVKKGRGNLIINLGNSTQTLNVASEAVTVQGNTVTINPPEDFPSGTNVNILMLSGVFTDLANNSYAGIDDAETWNFSVPDNIPPVRTLLYPPDNSTDVPPNINLIMVFSENIKKGTGNITITREGTTQTQVVDVTSDAVTVSGTTVIINPVDNFPAAAIVSIQMPAGVFTDISGNPYAGISDPTEWNLTISGTIDVTPPSITDLQPADDAIDVAPTSNLVITFSENVQKGTGNITLTQGTTTQTIPVTSEAVSIDGATVTIDPPNDLPEGAAVHVQIPSGVFSDVSNNVFAGITDASTWNFTVNTAAPSDNIAPLVSTLSPADNAVNVALDASLVITFNEAVKKGSGLIVIQQNNSNRIINVSSNEVSVNGNVVTINPSVNFPAKRPLYILITEGTFKDIAGNDFAGISEETGWNFTTGAPVDNTAPTVTAYAPADNAQNVPVNANLVLTFNETVKKGTGNITLTQGNITQTINVTSNAVSITGNRVTINPVADFPASTAISVQMPAGVFTDNAGNNYAGITNATTWNFTTAAPADNTPPAILTLSPDDGATNVAVNASLSITFSEPVVKGAGNITITQGANTQTIAVSNAAVSVNGATVTINPADFPEDVAVSVQIAAGTFKDVAGNNFAGITNATTWNFTTIQAIDNTPPQVLTLSPVDNAGNVAPNTNLVITFNEAVKAGTGTIVINQGDASQNIAVPGASIIITGSTVTINPPADFPAGASIDVVIPSGAITDLAGNAYEGLDATQWSFTVAPGADNIPPQISTLSPVNNAVNVAIDVNLSITFNEAVEKGTGNILIRQGNTILQTIDVTNASITISGNTLTINPSVNFPAGTLLNIQMENGVVEDAEGNAFAGVTNATTWRFTTVAPTDNTPPVLSTLSPENGTTNVAATTNLSLTFTENIKKKTGTITLTVNGVARLIPVTDASVTISGNTVTINPAADFPDGAQVSVLVPAGAISDEADNNFNGIASSAWQFTIATPVDNIPPVVTTFSPADNSMSVGVNTDLVMTFNEPIEKGNGNIEIRQDGTLQTIPVSDPAVIISGNTVTINPASDFRYGASVNVQMLSGVFVDKAGNPFAGIGNAGVWGFETAVLPDQVTPIVTTLSPADDTQNVAPTENLVITFSEQVQKGTGNISISQNGTVQQIPVSDAAVSISENIVTINPAADFIYEANVFVEIDAGAFKDNSNNAFAGISGNELWNFTIASAPDSKAPTILSVNPEDEAADIAPDTELTITFSEQIQKGSGTIILTQGTSSQTIDINSDAVSISGEVLTINPETDFPSGASVSVLILPGAITDLAGNPFAGITDATTWNFTIQDVIAPQLMAIFPEDGATGIAVNTNLVMSFDEEIKKGAGVITISDGITTQTIDVNSDAVIVSGTTVIINPPANFAFDAAISVLMPSGVFTDLAGNPFAGITDPAAWTIMAAGFVDDVPPAVVSLSPEDNATLVPANTILEMVFSENVQKGTGSITINQGSISKALDISSGSVTVNGAKVTITPGIDFDLGAEVHVLVPKGVFSDLSNNPFAGIVTATGWNFTIDPTVPVSIVSTSFPEVILSSEATTQASVELNRVPPGLKVEFVSRGISRQQWQKQLVSSNSLIFTASMPQASFDEIGLEYYFDITLASGFKIASDTGYTYIQYVGNGLDVTELKFGAQVSDYQIISIPLELTNKQVNNVLEDNLGEYNIKKWRLFNYKNELLQEYKDGFTTLEAGEAYWLIVKDEANVNTGEGTTLKVRKNNPYTLSLKKGWNQIGNPYNFNISWNDVRTYNNNPEGLGNLRPFEEEFLDSDILKRQRGAFVFVENDMTLQIPVLKNNTANGRISAEQEMKFTPNALWQINFALRSKEMPYRLAGLGMHPEASPSKDRYDDITVPRFVKYLEMNFKHPEYFAPDFTRDMRPVEENQMWEFTVESNLEPQAVNLQWHSYFSQGYEPGKKLMLLDVDHNKIVDLSRQTQYSFWQDSLTTFKMYYGTPEYIQEHLQSFQTTLSENYPNPFKDNTTITFILSKIDATYQVKLEVYSINGQKVATLAEGAYASGAYQINWDGTDTNGRKLPPGMYIYQLETNSESGPATFTRKLVLQ